MVLQAVAAPVDHGDADINQFIHLALERAAHTGVEAEKVLKHVGTVRQRLLHVARSAFQLLLIDLLYFGCGMFGFDERDSRHGVLEEWESASV